MNTTLNHSDHPYSDLLPDIVMDAVEAQGFYCDHRLYPLNSYENRVYQVGVEDHTPLIAKFYRPGRWQQDQIQAEHDALLQLKDAGVSVAAPIVVNDQTLFHHNGFDYSLTNKLIGDVPEAGNLDHLYQIGELIGAIHKASTSWSLPERPYASNLSRIERASQQLLKDSCFPTSLQTEYVKTIEQLLLASKQTVERSNQNNVRFIHGDCHRSNLILSEGLMTALDFDDCRMGYAVQDIWMHLSDENERQAQLSELIEGYESFCAFDTRELDLIDVLIAERTIVYTAWIAERWSDPAFPKLFPHFTGKAYWDQHLADLNRILDDWGNWR